MGTKVHELTKPTEATRTCDPERGGCCSVHRRPDRVYMDHLWRWSLAHPGERPFGRAPLQVDSHRGLSRAPK